MRYSAILMLLLFIGISQSAVVKYDDFESYEPGSVTDVTAGTWVSDSGTAQISTSASGSKICYNPDGTCVYSSLGAYSIPGTDTQTTVFFRFYTNLNEDSLIGICDNGDATPDLYDDMDAYLIVGKESSIEGNGNTIYARSGSSEIDLFPDDSSTSGWYNVWMVINAGSQTYQVYINQGAENATVGDLKASGLDFRDPTGSDIISFANLWGTGLQFDDIYITPGLDLTNPPMTTQQPPEWSENLLLWWPMDSGSGTTVFDSTSNGYDGVISGASWHSTGYDGTLSCLDFDGGQSTVTDADAGLYLNGLEAVTVSVWVKSNVTGTDKGFMNTKDPDNHDDVLGIRYDQNGYAGGGVNVIKAAIATTGGVAVVESSNYAQTTDWQHIVLTWSDGEPLKLFINGVEDNPTYIDGPVFGEISSVSKLMIGRGAHDDNYSGWDGLIDQLAIYDRALTANEILSLYNGAEPSSIVTQYPMMVDAGNNQFLTQSIDYVPLRMSSQFQASSGQTITDFLWSLESGPEDVIFSSVEGCTENDPNAMVYFSEPGSYVLKFQVSDSTPQTVEDTVTVTVIESALRADINNDNKVDLSDLHLLCSQWLDPWGCIEHPDVCANLIGHDSVDLKDFASFAMQWLVNIFPEASEVQYLTGQGKDDPVLWDFYCTSGRQSGYWTKIPVPSNWELQGFGGYNYGHNTNKSSEQGLYKRTFSIPQEWAGKRVLLYFDGVMTDTQVSVNGQPAGPVHQGGFYRFKYDITDKVIVGSTENLLEVTVSKISADSSVETAERQADYWVFGGIYRPVYLQAVPQEYIDWTSIDAKANGSFSADIYIANRSTVDSVTAQITELDGTPVGPQFQQSISPGQSKVVVSTNISNPRLWSAESPNLYYVNFTLRAGQGEVYSLQQRFGFRTIEVRYGDGIYLNGERILLKGVNRHSFWPDSGRCMSKELSYSDIQMIKDINMNAVRMSHYPPDQHFLEYCDEIGLYVLDELAGWQWPPYNTGIGEKLVEEMLTRDVNHACILFWDNGNEGGWNTALDDDFAIYDRQNRSVLHPWTTFSGINTDHYETYPSVQNILSHSTLYMPTGFLHGLYDGGHGAGLEDYWNLISGSPLGAGGFLWVFADEGVVRTDIPGFIDTDGNHAPDGIVGPYHGKEGSFYTIKEIWCPIQTTLEKLPVGFNGTVPFENLYDFTNLSECTFQWQLVDFKVPDDLNAGYDVINSGTLSGPSIAPDSVGNLNIPLPADWQNRDALYLTATDWTNRKLWTWTWPIQNQQDVREQIVDFGTGTVSSSVDGNVLTVTAGSSDIQFDLNTGLLMQAINSGQTYSLSNGPRRVPAGSGTPSVTYGSESDHYYVQASTSQGLDLFRWEIYPSGWVQLSYQYSIYGDQDYFGITFDYPEDQIVSKKFLGEGPYRVWKNRIKGTQLNVWQQDYNNAKPGREWEYPEFNGCFADLFWASLNTQQGDITFVTDTDDLYLRLFTPAYGDSPTNTAPGFPAGNISFLHGIPAIGTKFHPATSLGPQSQRNQANGAYEGVLYFNFGN